MEIPNINVHDIRLPTARVFELPPTAVHNIFVPVTVNIGSPIVNMPGCVESHPDGGPQLAKDDPKGTRIFCTNEYPSYNAMDYTPEQLAITTKTEAEPPPVAPPVDPPEPPEVPTDAIPNIPNEEVPCPGPNAPRIGDVAQNQKERVSGFELQNGICVTLYEDIPWTAQYLPAPQTATTTAAIAVTAASSALLAKPLADLLLKAFKPVINKVIAKVKKLMGKKPPRLSTSDRRAQQRISSHALRKLKGKE
jgi:hypothetical protein